MFQSNVEQTSSDGRNMTSEQQEAAKEDASREKLEAATKKLSAGIETLVASDRWKKYLKFQGKFHRYSFCNTLLIMLQRPDATLVASYRSWQNLNRWVKKGEGGN